MHAVFPAIGLQIKISHDNIEFFVELTSLFLQVVPSNKKTGLTGTTAKHFAAKLISSPAN